MIVYKVVWLDRGKLLSIGPMDEMACEYAIGKTTLPPIGYLFAFRDLASAQVFVAPYRIGWHVLQIYEAEADVVEQSGDLEMASTPDSRRIRRFWEGGTTLSRTLAPDGTVYCRSITLLEEVT